MTEPQATLFDQHGEPLERKQPDIGRHAMVSGSQGYYAMPPIWTTTSSTRCLRCGTPYPCKAHPAPEILGRHPSPLIVPQTPPQPKPRRRVLLTQGYTRPHIDTGRHYGEPKHEAP